MDFSF